MIGGHNAIVQVPAVRWDVRDQHVLPEPMASAPAVKLASSCMGKEPPCDGWTDSAQAVVEMVAVEVRA